jgi:hypothetical protein
MKAYSSLSLLSPELAERVLPYLKQDEQILDVVDRNVSFLQSSAGRSMAYSTAVFCLVLSSLWLVGKQAFLQFLGSGSGFVVILEIAFCAVLLAAYSSWDRRTKKYLLITDRQVIAVDVKPVAGLPAVKALDLKNIKHVSASRISSKLTLRGGPRLFGWRHFILDFEDPESVAEKIRLRQAQSLRTSKLS